VEKVGQRDMKDRWAPRRITLELRLGNFILFSKSISAKELVVHFSQLSSDPGEPPPPIEELSSGLEAALISAHPIAKRLPALEFHPRVIRYVPAHYRRFSIDLQGSFDDYLKKFSSKSRKTLAREVRRFSELSGGTLCWREYRGRDDLEEFNRLAREVSKKSWQEKLQDIGFPESAEFWDELSERAVRDAMRGYILFHRQRPVAYAYCEVEGGVLVYGLVGYDSEYDRWSPGTVLLYLIIQKQFQERIFSSFDLGGREDWYKEFFATRSTLCADILYFPRHARNILFLLLHRSFSSLNRTASRALELLHLRSFVRRLLRKKIPAVVLSGDRSGVSF